MRLRALVAGILLVVAGVMLVYLEPALFTGSTASDLAKANSNGTRENVRDSSSSVIKGSKGAEVSSHVDSRFALSESLVAFVRGSKNYRSLYTRLSTKPSDLTHEDLMLLDRIYAECIAARHTVADYRAELAQMTSIDTQARREAAIALETSCRGIADSSGESAAIASEMARRKHSLIDGVNAVANATLGRSEEAVGRLMLSLAKADPMSQRELLGAMGSAASTIVAQIGGEYTEVTSRDLQRAWELAMCDYAEACSADVPSVAGRCVATGQCDATSPIDAIRRYEPENFDRLNSLRNLISASTASADWSWLQPDAHHRKPSDR